MAAKSRELFLAALLLLLLSTCALVHCLDADKIEAPKSLPEAEKDFPAEHLIEAENDEERKLGKRVVNWSAWQKQKEQLNRSPYQQSASQQGSLAQYTNGGHGYEFHRQNPSIPVGNPDVKWTSLHHGHNEFSQGYDDKEDDEWYEGISSESTKPRKEKLPKSPADHSDMVAKYDVARGVQCPSADATGIFVYPPDCKFYVTCWNGRAFVQPCAPGTLFSPDSLECDFPDKVKCYGGEIADFPGVDVDHLDESAGVREPLLNGGHSARYEAQGQLEPSCPPNMNGLLDHPSDCAKFLQCANGQTYVMSCGPGSVFNPMTTVCDHPRNVPGCEDAAAVDDDGEYSGTQQPPIDHDYAGSSSLHTSVKPTSHGSVRTAKKVECPAEFSGLLPHPETCAKFLQCANGATYVMDCGPGTVFNPLTTVCDWPYNVPGCGAKKNPAQQSANNSPSYEQPGLSTYPSHTTHNQNWNAQGHNQQGISGVTVNHQGSATTNQGYGHQGSVNSQGYGHQGHYGGSSTTQGHQGQHGGSVGHHGQFAGQGNTQGYGHQGHFAGSSTNQQGYVESGSQHGYNHQSNYGTSSSNQWHREGTDQSYYDSQYQGSSLNPASQHHDHHGHHSGSGDSNFGHQVPHHGQYQTTTYPYKLDVRGSYPDPNLQHPTQPSHPINGHAYPYNPQGSNKNQPKPAKSQPSDPESSSEEEHPGQNQGQAWAVPGGSPRPGAQTEKPWVMRIPNDRRNYSRTHDRWPTNSGTGNKWSTSESSQPKPGGTLQPSTWRGMGPGFENRPSIPGRGHPVISEGANVLTTNDKPYERPSNPNIQDSHNGQWAPVSTPSPVLLPPHENTKSVPPVLIYANPRINGTQGHPSPVIIQGHSRMREQHAGVPSQQETPRAPKQDNFFPSEFHHVMAVPSPLRPTTWKPEVVFPSQMNITMITSMQVEEPKPIRPKVNDPESLDSQERNKEFIYNRSPLEPDLPTVSIELEEDWNSSLPLPSEKPSSPRGDSYERKFAPTEKDVDEDSADTEDFTVEVETSDGTKPWKPQLVFPNKAKANPREEKSVVMRIGSNNNNNKRKNFLEDVEIAPFLDVICLEEPPFPAAYAPPQVKSSSLISGSHKPGVLTPLSGQAIRLRGGPDPSEGFVEVQGNRPGWGVVCDTPDGWTLKEAHVVCKQLGYRRGAAMAYQGRSRTTLVPKWIAANSVTCQGNETKFQNCKFTHKPECRVAKDAIAVRCLPHRVAHCRKDELAHDGQCYHFAEATQALNHAEAHDYCQRRGSRLIDVVDQAEHDFISEMLMQSQPHVDSVMTAGMGFTTLNKTIWMWEDSSVAKFKFSKWWPGWEGDRKTAPFAGTRPVCIILTRKFPCHDRQENHCKTDHFFWDVEDCASSNKGRAFICERAFEEIGCVYGNGNQYFGNASVAASGRDCLSWSDPQVSRSLMNKITSKEAREKLQSHNFCRNPNPNKESRPWCFTGPRGEYEYCDIPYCGKILSKKAHLTGSCKPKHFECSPGECIPSPWVCDGQEDCTNGADERKCSSHINFFKKYAKHRLDGYEVEKWLNTPAKTCALRCKEADFTCRSFTHQADGNVCYLSDSNIGMTGALVSSGEHDYYEMRDHTLDCEDMFVCANQKCINQTKVCDGKNDCLDRSDEKICTAENLDYGIRLGGANSSHEGRIEVKIFGKWGQVCDDGFDMIDANVVCRELGFSLGALEVRPGGFYGNLNPPDLFIVDQLKCRGNESSIRECDFEGWGKHNCEPEEAVGVVCKTDVDTCQEGHWKCDNSPMCIPTPFICDEVSDCPDGSDESSAHCDAPFELRLANGSSPMQGRVEIRHHGIWGTVCDDDFSNATAKVICRSLGYGGPAMVKKDGYFGPGTGPIWLDEVFCFGNETQLYKCEHDHWGRHNCDHAEDAGVICSAGPVPAEYESGSGGAEDREARIATELNIDDLLPTECGKRLEDFAEDDELIFERVVRSSVAPRGSYPWQASIRVRGHSKSSHWCGAVVLSPLHVLTAAHCLEGYNKGTYFVRAGDYNTEVDEGTEAEANIEDYYIHEDFRKGHRLNNDIAVVLLKGRGIPLGRNVMPICLPYENIEYPAGLNCTISGFGSVEAGSSTHSRKLRFGWVPLLDQSVCKADYVYGQSSITDGMICAGHLDGGPDTCDGDSGGPLACQHNGAFTLYGLTSWGQHCGRVNKPGVYVRIAHYRKWIDQKIRESLIGR
ncbi:uncharacterized protein LOC100120629 isoform X1 [Nasonia vitripennis]|uniref:Neurotrypsin n=1 Tax=Nasonia vitripennis TaxID=7425 RepID=A0A7M7Q8C1_NASVI|nr:uncharacterized protein LOC100120629 isoform X1 [Nasonia vitripennis]